MRLDYKSIIVKRYLLHLSLREIAEQTGGSKSGVSEFLRAFEQAEGISYPLPPGITNEGIEALVYPSTAASHSRDESYQLPDFALIHKEMTTRKNMTLVYLWGKYDRACETSGLKAYSYRQGGNISPLLANIMLNELDKELEARGLNFVRYADDLIIMVGSRQAAERVMKSVTHFIEEKLGLKVNAEKSKVDKPKGIKYLGFGFYFDSFAKGYKARPHPKAVAKFRAQMKNLTCRSWGVSNAYKVQKLNQLIRGWINYFKIGSIKGLCQRLDIGVILNNALSNAIMAASGSKDPYVEVKAWKNNNAYLIQVKNSFAGKLMLDSQTELPETSKDDKENHGYGLMNMKRITEKYYGTIQLEQREDMVIFTALLMIPD